MTRNCLNALRKIASISKEAEESELLTPRLFFKDNEKLNWATPFKILGALPGMLVETGSRAVGKKLGLNYDNNPEGWNQGTRPSRQDVLDKAQRMYDAGGKWKTPAGMNSLAMMAGGDFHQGNVYGRMRASDQEITDSMRRRQSALETLVKETPEYSSDRGVYAARANKTREVADTLQKDIDAAREERAAAGRKLFFDQGGRWSIPAASRNAFKRPGNVLMK